MKSSCWRSRDLPYVQELIKAIGLPRDFAERLNPYVREKFVELWAPPEGEYAD